MTLCVTARAVQLVELGTVTTGEISEVVGHALTLSTVG